MYRFAHATSVKENSVGNTVVTTGDIVKALKSPLFYVVTFAYEYPDASFLTNNFQSAAQPNRDVTIRTRKMAKKKKRLRSSLCFVYQLNPDKSV